MPTSERLPAQNPGGSPRTFSVNGLYKSDARDHKSFCSSHHVAFTENYVRRGAGACFLS